MTSWAQSQIQAANCLGTLKVGTVSLSGPAWAVLNIGSLWEPAPTRGENILIPFMEGRFTTGRTRDERSDSLQLLIVGTCDPTGEPTPDPHVGLEENVMWLNDNLFDYADVRYPLEVELTLPSGAKREGIIQIGTVKYGWEVGVAVTATVDYTLPYGRLAPA